ncbi:peptidoglycan DD-metalloendopeptidase family protein [Glutamicibacter sp.]|uniref:peptidoglycan DD-metalloendopeptidase family protein n=1 Tax=Glutamicibacter sp. TaxID=1931995 RepID=UPI002B461970|nr:peptidoglycan DD-metalloendopeptidase family protein [Glutamicibacter sp.]HJX77268.1 peptidoglycan DD-metalloendopeptidase family protein [Glutamicibacter sp.]
MASSVELATGYLTLAAETSLLAKQVGGIFKGAESQASKAGLGMGKAIAKGFEQNKPDVDSLAADVERAEKRVAAQAETSARKVEAAKRKSEIAQAKLNETTEKFGPKSSQALSAVDRLATAEQKLEAETKGAADAQNRLQNELKQSKDSLASATKASSTASTTYAKGWKGVGQKLKANLSKGMKTATTAANKQAEDGGKRAGGGFSSSFKGALGGLAAGFSIAAVAGGVKEIVGMAGDAEQSIGAIDTVFKENAQTMHDWAATAAQTVGISGNEYRELGTLLGSQLKNMGTPMDEIADKTNGLIGMGADMASMFGGTTKEAIEAISSALKGEMDPIEKYGITLSAATLEAEALSKGILKPVVDADKVATASTKMTLAQNKYNETLKKYGKDSDEVKRAQLTLTSAEEAYSKATAGKVPKLDAESKALAVQSALYGQGADAQGNFAREADTLQNKQQKASAAFADLKEKVGGAFLPAMTTAFGFINETAIPALESFSGWVGRTGDTIGQTLGPILQGATGWIQDNSTALTIGAGVIGALMIPMLIKWGIQATIAGAKNVAAFLLVRAEAIKTAAVFVAQSYKMIGQWVAMGVAAIRSGAQTVAVWALYKIEAAKAVAAMIATRIKIAAQWVAMSAAAVVSGAKTAAVWTGTVIKQAAVGAVAFGVQAGKVIASWALMATRSMVQALKMAVSWSVGVLVPAGKAAIAMGIQAAKVVAGWLLMGTQSLLQAGRMAAAWLIAMGPIGWAIAAIVGIAAIVIANWDKIKKFTIDTWNSVSGKIKDVWNNNIKPVFQALGSFINEHVKPAFQRGVDGIKKVWDTIKSIAYKPIDFVVNTVYNNGLREMVNTMSSKLGLDWKLPEVNIPAFAKGGHMKDGWKLVGEEGPELINTGPGYVYTANETQQMLAGKQQAPMAALSSMNGGHDEKKSQMPIGGFWDDLWGGVKNTVGKVKDWAVGMLAAGVRAVTAPLKDSMSSLIPGGGFNELIRGAGFKVIDGLTGWATQKDESAGGGSGSDSAMFFDGPLGAFSKPANGPITSGFGTSRGAYPHAGIDFAVSIGSAVRSMLNGVVRKIGWNAVTGRTGKGMVVDHADGFSSYYGHLSGWGKKPGDKVSAGERIANSGNTGRSTGPHLHAELWKNGSPFNYMSYLHDSGGWLQPGVSTIVNKTRKPEAILNPGQWDTVTKAVNNTVEGGFRESDIDRLIEAIRDREQVVSVQVDSKEVAKANIKGRKELRLK